MTRVLILGAGGQLGRSWAELLETEGIEHDAWTRREFTLGDASSLAKLRERACWDVIVNCSAYTAVDNAETEYEEAERINGTAVGELAACAKDLGVQLIHYSTDYVFDGQASVPYPVDAALNPVNAYGRSKALGERLLLDSGAQALLVRTSWVYAPWGKNFVLTMVRLLREKPELRVVGNQLGRPSSAPQLARRSWALSRKCRQGVFHLADADECSWHAFACAVRDELRLHTPVHPILTSDFPTPARRPAYSVLDTTRADELLGPASPWRTALREVLERWQRDQ